MFRKDLQRRRLEGAASRRDFEGREALLRGRTFEVGDGHAFLTASDGDAVEAEFVRPGLQVPLLNTARRTPGGWAWDDGCRMPEGALQAVERFALDHPDRLVAAALAATQERREAAAARRRALQDALDEAKKEEDRCLAAVMATRATILSLPLEDGAGSAKVVDDLSKNGLLSQAWATSVSHVRRSTRENLDVRGVWPWFGPLFEAYVGAEGTPAERLAVALRASRPKAPEAPTIMDDADLRDWALKAGEARIGLAMATRDPGVLHWSDGPLLEAHAPELARFVPAPPSGDVSVSVTACVTFAQAAPGGRIPRPVVREVEVAIRRVAAVDAPVTLRCMAGDGGGWLGFREVDGRLFRPVLAPDSWRPITVAEFADAVRGRRAWADDPYAAPPGSRASIPGPAARRPSVAPLHQASPARPGRDADAAVVEALATVGELLVVDGVVHRSTGVPTLHVVEGSGRNAAGKPLWGHSVAWNAGNLAMWDRQATLPHKDAPAFGLPNRLSSEIERVEAGAAASGAWEPLTFPASMADVADRVAAVLSDSSARERQVVVDGIDADGDPVEAVVERMKATRGWGFNGMGQSRPVEGRVGRAEPAVVAEEARQALGRRYVPQEGKESMGEAYRALCAVLAEALDGAFPREEMDLAVMAF